MSPCAVSYYNVCSIENIIYVWNPCIYILKYICFSWQKTKQDFWLFSYLINRSWRFHCECNLSLRLDDRMNCILFYYIWYTAVTYQLHNNVNIARRYCKTINQRIFPLLIPTYCQNGIVIIFIIMFSTKENQHFYLINHNIFFILTNKNSF